MQFFANFSRVWSVLKIKEDLFHTKGSWILSGRLTNFQIMSQLLPASPG